VARFGGDEFTVLVRGYESRNEAVSFAEDLLTSFEQPFAVNGISAFVTASLGIAFAIAGDDPELVMRNADAAMYEAKRNGRARLEQFDATLTLSAAERVSTESDLHLGLARDEFQLVYQPVVSMEDGSLTGMEALIRWHHPSRGVIPPVRFIPLAEETGLVVPIGHWVLGEALRQTAQWRARHPNIPDFSMSVNISGRQLEHDQFVNETGDLLKATGVPPHLLTLEITESLFIRDIAGAIRRLDALKQLGLRLAIDDFGTGFSSLAALSKLPVNAVKVDKSFIDSIGGDHDAVVAAIVQLADAYGLQVIAEGIERQDQRNRLIELGYRYAQGYYFHRPLSIADADQLLHTIDLANG
jgi:EAL domain-containing protein (putative c-di-GMP-specific phosphodiesterase class I)